MNDDQYGQRNLSYYYFIFDINPDAATTEEVPYSIKTPVRTGTASTGFMGWSEPENNHAKNPFLYYDVT